MTQATTSARAGAAPTGELERVAQGDRGALRALYEAHAPRLYAMAVALLRDRSEAEDVIQETFVDVWRRAKDFDPARGSAGGWICSIARNHAIDRLRSRDAAARALAAAPREPAGPPPPPAIELATARQEREAVVAALDSLPPEQRTAIELAYYEGLSQREIAERQGEPIGTIKTRVRLAMQKLSGLLAGLGGPS